MSTVYTRFVTLKNGRRLDAHDYGKQVFAFEGDANYQKPAGKGKVTSKKKLAAVSADNNES